MAEPKAGMLTQFNGGEFGDNLAGRVDYARLKTSLRKAVNVIPEVAGGLKKFYGTKYITEFTSTSRFLMIPFHHVDGLFTIVFHDDIMDVICDGQFVNLGISLPYIDDYSEIRYEQANDVVILCVKDQPMFQVSYYGKSGASYDFRLSQCNFSDVPYFPFGYNLEYNGRIKTTGITGRITVETSDDITGRAIIVTFPSRLTTAGSNNLTGNIYAGATARYLSEVSDVYAAPTIGDIHLRVQRNRSGNITEIYDQAINNKIVKKMITKSTSDRSVNWYYGYNSLTIESMCNGLKNFAGDGVTIDHVTREDVKQIIIPEADIPGHQSGDIYRILVTVDASSVDNSLILLSTTEEIKYEPNIQGLMFLAADSTSVVNACDESSNVIPELSVNVVAGSATYDITDFRVDVVTSHSTRTNVDNLVGRRIKFYQNSEADAVKVWYQELNVNTNAIVLSDGHYYRATTSGTCGNIKPTHTEGVVSDGKVNWQYLHSGTVSGTIVSVLNSSTMIVDLGKATLPIATYPNNPGLAVNYFSNYRWSIWGAGGRYPSQIFFANGRMGVITNTRAGTYYSLSCSDDYFNFAEDEYGQTLDTSSVTGLISGGNISNEINWVIAREKIYCGSYGAEFVIGGQGEIITPSSVYCKPVSFTGGDDVAALKYMTLSMFVGAGGNELYSVTYDYATDTYQPTNISYVSEHLLKSGIKKIVAAPRPDKTIYLLTKEGKLVQFVNYVTEQVNAFSELDISSGKIVDISVSYSGNNVGILFAYEDNDTIFVESFCTDNPTYMLSTELFSFNEPTNIVSSPRFTNKDAYVFYYDENESISKFELLHFNWAGACKLKSNVLNCTVGLPMNFEINTQPLFGSKLEGAQQASIKISMRLLNSGHFSYGTSNDYDRFIDFKSISSVQEYGSPHLLTTGDVELNIPSGYAKKSNIGNNMYSNSTGVGINIKSSVPEPFNLLSISEVYK